MKKLTYIYILMLAVLFGACEDEAEKVTISSEPIAPSLTGPGAGGLEFVLADRNETIDFTWEESDFGFDASITYVIELSTDATFENKIQVLTAQGSTASALVDDVNVALLGLGLPFGESATVQARVLSAVSTKVDTLSSAASEYTATPYETIYPIIYAPGAYQGWSPGADIGRLYSYGFNSVYEGVLRIVDAAAGDPTANTEFKITPEASWDTAWGVGTLTATGANYSGTIDGGDNIAVAPGVYHVTVDVNALSIELEKTDDWGIIGDSTPGGWDADTDMTYNGQRQVWELTTDLVAGELKFRANDGWDLNYGDTGADGTIDAGGDNIAVTAGNYTIILSLNKETYELIAN